MLASFSLCFLMSDFRRTGLSVSIMLLAILEMWCSLAAASATALPVLALCLGAIFCQDHPNLSCSDVVFIALEPLFTFSGPCDITFQYRWRPTRRILPSLS